LHRAAFHRGWSTEEFEQILIERNALAHRLRIGGSTIGFIISRTAADEAEILSVAVAQKHRGRGFSRDLLRTHLDTWQGTA
jgi:ribosomal-protein-alanine N-acetyltransferase